MTRPADLTWPPDASNADAWIGLTAPELSIVTGDLGADHGPSEPVTADSDGDWLADREDDRRWRQWP